jgi:glycosyltransferase involved in cell wall biosynthesis
VSIYAPGSWPLYLDGGRASTGGAELQMWHLAHGLAGAGLRVCHVISGNGDGPPHSGQVALVYERFPDGRDNLFGANRRVVNALTSADAALYVQRSAGFATGVVGTYARLRGRAFVFSSSSDGDLTRASLAHRSTAASFRLGVRCANAIVVQTESQRALARETLRRSPQVIPSYCEPALAPAHRREYFLWVGAAIDYKGPLEMLDLARAVPEATFVMVLGRRGNEQALHAEVQRAAQALPNVELLSSRPRREILALYDRAIAVVNTSAFEGMPNVLLEGWARGVPALTLHVDPGGVIVEHGLGAVARGSMERLAAETRDAWTRRDGFDPRRDSAQEYVGAIHAPDVVTGKWLRVLRPHLMPKDGDDPSGRGPRVSALAHATGDKDQAGGGHGNSGDCGM